MCNPSKKTIKRIERMLESRCKKIKKFEPSRQNSTTANYREWRNIFKLRTPVAAHPQMRELMCPLLKELQSKIPVVFDDIYTYWPKDDQTRKESVEE